VDFDFCLLEFLGAFAAEAPLAGGFLFLLGGLILSDVSDFSDMKTIEIIEKNLKLFTKLSGQRG
jgi:hypothetical protein